jgi:hypothetical protein
MRDAAKRQRGFLYPKGNLLKKVSVKLKNILKLYLSDYLAHKKYFKK